MRKPSEILEITWLYSKTSICQLCICYCHQAKQCNYNVNWKAVPFLCVFTIQNKMSWWKSISLFSAETTYAMIRLSSPNKENRVLYTHSI